MIKFFESDEENDEDSHRGSDGGSDEASHRASNKISDEGSDDGSDEGSDESSDEGSDEESDEDSEQSEDDEDDDTKEMAKRNGGPPKKSLQAPTFVEAQEPDWPGTLRELLGQQRASKMTETTNSSEAPSTGTPSGFQLNKTHDVYLRMKAQLDAQMARKVAQEREDARKKEEAKKAEMEKATAKARKPRSSLWDMSSSDSSDSSDTSDDDYPAELFGPRPIKQEGSDW
ncbi:uncharacterized protein N7482_010703 [Penicillium canariense]|uniref:Uncharacterized protein n=1 Tax=Penicillium canariense TaxID=189055 RepID=A0A9W9HL51_9EURO|nr:uncharacterized protein N7482_010703 [Penicillium canariense]KAJ5151451.1 hypothetical protein N7482_010703 [Penicillium canariense]